MFRIALLSAVFIQVVMANVPPHCRGPPPGLQTKIHPNECCKHPKIFTEQDFKECGMERFENEAENIQRPPPDCNKQICLLERYNLMKDESSIDKDAVTAYMKKLASENKEFADAIDLAIEKCLTGKVPGRPEVCEVTRMVACVSYTLFMNCPAWENADDCKKIKDHIEECKKYYVNP